MDNNDHWTYGIDTETDETRRVGDTPEVSLQEFFSRPVKIRQYLWDPATIFFEQFNPWDDFFSNPRVVNRINNYSMMRAKLCVKFVINGNPFYYGRLLASYRPLHNFDQVSQERNNFIDSIEASQRPHVFIDPTSSVGGTICCPFIWPDNMASIVDEDYIDLGRITVRTLNPLKHANGTGDPLDVTVFAWAEEVVLAAPTTKNANALVPQMGTLDEFGTGPISRPAGLVARIAGALREAPMISPYAKATELAASAVSSIATMFGFSRPAILTDINPYRPTYCGNLANTNVPDSTTKLTLDAKSETSVDPRVMGLGGADEMTITSLSTRESFFYTFPWAPSNASETLLFSVLVTPEIFNYDAGTEEYHLTPACWATMPFRKWRGTIRFRFQVVCSNFHKGRLKFVYDPYGIDSGDTEYNTAFTRIVDIAEEKDFTIDIGWANKQSWLRTKGLSASLPFDPSATFPSTMPYANGTLSVYVVNPLSNPNPDFTNTIEINAFSSTTPDFEVVEPSDSHILGTSYFPKPGGSFTATGMSTLEEEPVEIFEPSPKSISVDALSEMAKRFVPQMGALEDDVKPSNSDTPTTEDALDSILKPVDVTDKTQHVYYADPVVSVRQLCKRYSLYRFLTVYDNNHRLTKWTLPTFPSFRGYSPTGTMDTVSGDKFNYTAVPMMNWFTPGYICRRGAVRYKFSMMATNYDGLMLVNRKTSDGGYFTVRETFNPTSLVNTARIIADNWPSGVAGGHMSPVKQNSTLEVELPWYTKDRFHYGKNIQNELTFTSKQRSDSFTFSNLGNYQGTSLFMGAMSYVAAGEDFALGFFCACPIVYVYSAPTDPTGTGV